MIEVKPMHGDIAVCAQVRPEDMEELAAAGFKSVICNRPDGEEPDQPTMEENRRAAEEVGLVYACLPIVGTPTDEQIAEFNALVERLPKPIVAHCKGGGRSSKLVSAVASPA